MQKVNRSLELKIGDGVVSSVMDPASQMPGRGWSGRRVPAADDQDVLAAIFRKSEKPVERLNECFFGHWFLQMRYRTGLPTACSASRTPSTGTARPQQTFPCLAP